MLDPCAAEGFALARLAGRLLIPGPQIYAVELNQARAERCREHLPAGAHVIGPCSFFGTEIQVKSFSLIYLNPPFDYAEGGGLREEESFLTRAWDLLAPAGVIILVCPYNQLVGGPLAAAMDSMFDQVEVYKFPDGNGSDGKPLRPYNEVCAFGVRRKEKLDHYKIRDLGCMAKRGWHSCWGDTMALERLPSLGEPLPERWERQNGNGYHSYYNDYGKIMPAGRQEALASWLLPYCWPPRRFAKAQLTDEELDFEIQRSPLWSLLREPTPRPAPRPPLSLGKGHTSLAIVSGTLDGLVPSDPPHVARGFSIKTEYENKALGKSEVNPDSGAVTETKVISEKPVSVVRCVEKDEFGSVKLYEFRSDATSGNGDDEDDYCDEED
jgi:hypothetical protein